MPRHSPEVKRFSSKQKPRNHSIQLENMKSLKDHENLNKKLLK